MTGRSDDARSLERRHASLLAEVATPSPPRALRERRFLDGIYARTADAAEATCDPAVRAVLTEPLRAPHPDVEVDVSPHARRQLRSLEPVSAPGWMGSRVRGELRDWADGQRRRRRRARYGQLAAAALLLTTVLVWTGVGSTPDSGRGDDEIVIVRHRVEAPLAPGYSAADIVRRVADAGGRRAR